MLVAQTRFSSYYLQVFAGYIGLGLAATSFKLEILGKDEVSRALAFDASLLPCIDHSWI
jgi:hypothetical protein